MDVTIDNFKGALHLLQRLLPGAAFAAIDFEFSGLGFSRPSNLDTPQRRYEVARQDARTHAPIQFGLSVFHNVSSPDHKTTYNQTLSNPPSFLSSSSSPNWHTTTFNFNLFPRAVYFPYHQRYPLIDREIQLQSSTVHFLSSHGFDFGKVLNFGISWLRGSDEAILRKTVTDILVSRRNPKHPINDNDISEEDAAFVAEFKSVLDKWIAENDHPPAQTSRPPPKVAMFGFPRTPMSRRLVFDLVREKYPRIACLICHTADGLRLRIALHASAQLAEKHRQRDLAAETEQIVIREVGARLIFDLLREHQITIVVHHGLIDLTKLYANFVGDLPTLLSDFKNIFKKEFPFVYDTKWEIDKLREFHPNVAHLLPNDSHARYELSDYIAVMRRIVRDNDSRHGLDIKTLIPKKIWYDDDTDKRLPVTMRVDHVIVGERDQYWDEEVDELGFSRYFCSEDGEFKHEAGYDALQTGILFTLIRRKANIQQVESCLNKIYLSSCGGYRHIDFDSDTDVNEWFDRNTIIVTGQRDAEGKDHRCRQILRYVLKETEFDSEKSGFVVVSKAQFIGLLKPKDGIQLSDSPERLEKVIARGRDANLTVVQYRLEALINSTRDADRNEHAEHKRRKLE